MNDIADAKASLASQLAIFQRKHNWIMCVLYIGTFGSLLGFRQDFRFGQVTVSGCKFSATGLYRPAVGALARAGSGWISDKFGGGRVTLWVFVVMIAGTLGVLYFLDQGSAGCILRILCDVPPAVCGDGRGQCLHLPDDPGHFLAGS
jgi:NNP family nitrate/nitrite transporter-like MFS transporter